MRRIFIIGGPGSGKTTLARILARRLGVPAFGLDTVAYGPGGKEPLEHRLEGAQRIARVDGWAAEGIYLWWTDVLFQRADVIVWLDPPWSVAAYRIIQRHIRASLAGTNRYPGIWRLVKFVYDSHSFYAGRRPAPRAPDDDRGLSRKMIALHLAPYRAKVVYSRRNADIEVLVARLSIAR